MNGKTARNMTWNFAGQGLPMVVALFTIPYLIHRLGNDRFGLLSIAWVIVGYLSLFDLGLGRAMTRQIAIKLHLDKPADVPVVFWTALSAMAALGLLGAAVVIYFSDMLVTDVLVVPDELHGEARRAVRVLALGLPVTILSTGLVGVLEAFEAFSLSATIRLLTGLLTYIVPALTAIWTANIAVVVLALVLGRALIAVLNFVICVRTHGALRIPSRLRRNELAELLKIGGWMTVSNLVSPIMATLDRFFLGALISVGAITYYVTPADALTKALIVPVAVTGVLFPVFSGGMSTDRIGAYALYRRSWDVVFLVLVSFVFLVAVFGQAGLAAWIDPNFAERSTTIAKWIAFGVLANGLAQLPYSMLQASGRARAVAIIHLIELPVYIGSLVVLVMFFGIMGAAMAWTLRVTVDLLVLLGTAGRLGDGFLPLVTPLWHGELALLMLAVVLSAVALPMGVASVLLGTGLVAATALLALRIGYPLRGFGRMSALAQPSRRP